MHGLKLHSSTLLICLLLFSLNTIAAEQTYVREYTYQANALDTKISARAIALQEVKRSLLNELGTHISSYVQINRSSDGTQLAIEEIQTLSAGVTKVLILNEKWDGSEYVLKAQIKADPESVLKSLHKMLNENSKQKQILQLNGELSEIRLENISISESLMRIERKNTIALAEIKHLRNQLGSQLARPDLQDLKTRYQKQVDTLTLNEWHEMAMRYYLKEGYQNSFQLFKKIAEQGDAAAQTNIGWMYTNGEGVTRDSIRGAYWYQEAAEQGDAYAQVILGAMHIEGKVTIYDPAKAMYWFHRSAEQGHNIAQFNIGGLYDDGIGVARDVKQAAYWYQKAAEQGNIAAQFNIGVMYEGGIGVKKDLKQALHWHTKAAMQGDSDAQLSLAGLYFYGEGIVHNASQAAYWYQKSAEQGNLISQKNLAKMYLDGNGVVRDIKQTAYWVKKAAEQGDVNAQKDMAVMCAKGKGVTRDPVQAMYWIRKAAEQGDADAQSILQQK